MKTLASFCLLVVIGLVATVAVSHASRATKSHALSDCVQEADIILTGLVRSVSDDGKVGVLQVSVIQMLKSPQPKNVQEPVIQARQTVAIANSSFHSKYQRGIESPIPVNLKEAYIFFLKAAPNQKGQYELFDWCDGVMQVNQPVLLEIRNQLKKADTAK